jgi:predicted metal-dependent peptidase
MIDDKDNKLLIAIVSVITNKNTELFSSMWYSIEDKYFNDTLATARVYIPPDGKIQLLFNSEILNQEYSVKNIKFIILHELMHILYLHLFLRKDADFDHDIANLATDHVINEALKRDENIFDISFPKEGFLVPELVGQNLSWVEVYDYIMKNYDKIAKEWVIDLKNKTTNEIISAIRDIISDLAPQNKKLTEEQINNVKVNIITTIQNNPYLQDLIKNRSNSTNSVFQIFKDFITVEIPWEVLLEKAVLKQLALSRPSDDRTWRTINKKILCHNYILPGKDQEETIDTILFCIDTSGSMSDTDIKKAINIVDQSYHKEHNIRLIMHDTIIQQNIILSDINDIYKVIGRGGTSHQPVFDWIENYIKENDDLSLIVFITDFCSDIESIWNNYKWKDEIPYVFIVTPLHSQNVKDYDPDYIIIK